MKATIKLPSYAEINEMVKSGQLVYHHSAARRGYISVKADMGVESYIGKFGEGFVVRHANLRMPLKNGHCSNRYYMVDFYLYIA